MRKLRFVISLATADNDYQAEQVRAAEEASRRLGVEIRLLYANSGDDEQNSQLLRLIQCNPDERPDGILVEPVRNAALPQVAQAAAAAGIAWVVLNRDVDYIQELRRAFLAPAFAIISDHQEIGRIQGQQLLSLLPAGGSVLYLTGPSESLAAKQRTEGLYESKPAEVQIKILKAQWTEPSAYRAISSWLRLSTSRKAQVDVIAAQNDVMAAGAKKAFQEQAEEPMRERWASLPYLGCDGLANLGLVWVKQGLLTATVRIPPTAGLALELLVAALQQQTMPAERILTIPESFPPIAALASDCGERIRVLSAGA